MQSIHWCKWRSARVPRSKSPLPSSFASLCVMYCILRTESSFPQVLAQTFPQTFPTGRKQKKRGGKRGGIYRFFASVHACTPSTAPKHRYPPIRTPPLPPFASLPHFSFFLPCQAPPSAIEYSLTKSAPPFEQPLVAVRHLSRPLRLLCWPVLRRDMGGAAKTGGRLLLFFSVCCFSSSTFLPLLFSPRLPFSRNELAQQHRQQYAGKNDGIHTRMYTTPKSYEYKAAEQRRLFPSHTPPPRSNQSCRPTTLFASKTSRNLLKVRALHTRPLPVRLLLSLALLAGGCARVCACIRVSLAATS